MQVDQKDNERAVQNQGRGERTPSHTPPDGKAKKTDGNSGTTSHSRKQNLQRIPPAAINRRLLNDETWNGWERLESGRRSRRRSCQGGLKGSQRCRANVRPDESAKIQPMPSGPFERIVIQIPNTPVARVTRHASVQSTCGTNVLIQGRSLTLLADRIKKTREASPFGYNRIGESIDFGRQQNLRQVSGR
jgi:hypothetical protein